MGPWEGEHLDWRWERRRRRRRSRAGIMAENTQEQQGREEQRLGKANTRLPFGRAVTRTTANKY